MEMARSMLFDKGMPKSFGQKVLIQNLLNICPTKIIWNMTPFEALSGRKSLVNHLNIFGCLLYSSSKIEEMKLK